MRLVYKKEKYLEYSKRKAARIDKYKHRSIKKKQKTEEAVYLPLSKIVNNTYGKTKYLQQIKAPTHLSLIDNTEETLLFLNSLFHYAKEDKHLFIDLENVTMISSDAVLYLLSVFDICKQLGKLNVTGNAPKDQKCKIYFLESGFYNYVKSDFSKRYTPDNIFEIKTGENVDQENAFQVVQFSLNKLRESASVVSTRIQGSILECMGNVMEHAYETKAIRHKPKWWITSVYNQDRNVVSYTILDNGMGIPSTIRKRMREKLLPFTTDSEMIFSAFKGDIPRSRTKISSRGRGLPSIFTAFKKRYIKNLTVISRKGLVSFKESDITSRQLNIGFLGTLIYWEHGEKNI